MEFLFPFLFLLAFAITKKDLAFVTAGSSWLAVLILTGPGEGWAFHAKLVFLLFCNAVIFFVAQNHWKNYGQSKLARAIMWLSVAAMVSTSAYLFSNEVAKHIFWVLQSLTLLAILTLDGRKEFADDVARLLVRPFRHHDGIAGDKRHHKS
jgi:hypothetical protein